MLQIVLTTFIRSIPRASILLVIGMGVHFTFALVGMALFMGQFSFCSDPTIPNKEQCAPSLKPQHPRTRSSARPP